VIWGQAPGAEAKDEAPASTKLDQLLRYCNGHGDLDHLPDTPTRDLRQAAPARVRPDQIN
jgi:hypothetical protein